MNENTSQQFWLAVIMANPSVTKEYLMEMNKATENPLANPLAYQTCQEPFVPPQPLVERHVRRHEVKAGHVCEQCGKSLSCRDHLKRHYRTHTGEKPFACEHCGKTFSSKDHVKRHYRTHTGEKPFGCQRCGKSFSSKDHLKRHYKTHTGEKR